MCGLPGVSTDFYWLGLACAALRKVQGKVLVREKGGWGWRVRVQGKGLLVSLCGVSFFYSAEVHFWPTRWAGGRFAASLGPAGAGGWGDGRMG